MLTENTHFGAQEVAKIMEGCHGVFFIGIGGINMSSLAHLTFSQGYFTAGSDRTRTPLTERLAGEGIQVCYNHDTKNIEGCDVVVYTVAIPDDNPEYAAAKAKGLPCISRADYMGYLMSGYVNRIGVSGMHGKSTCTSMCAQIFIDSGADPTVLSGVELSAMGGAYRLGGKDNFIFEACEYRDSFLDFYPTAAVILNIEPDHLDYFSGIEQIKSSFVEFARRPGCRLIVANADDENVREVVDRAYVNTVTFGLHSPAADFRAINITAASGRYAFDILKHGEFLCHVRLAVPGEHNIMNALAAAAVADMRGINGEAIAKGLDNFAGAHRRMEYKGELNGAPVYDDYAHHPTEIRATLEGVAGMTAERAGEVICVFQSHTYDRTAALFNEFASSFENADRVIVADIYSARITNEHGVSAEKLANAIGGCAEYIGGMEAIADRLREIVRPEDTVVIMGAGDIGKVFDYLGL